MQEEVKDVYFVTWDQQLQQRSKDVIVSSMKLVDLKVKKFVNVVSGAAIFHGLNHFQ